jgi:hypothetical protein
VNKEFCINCGEKVLYEISKPKFCPSCGTPFNTSNSLASKRVLIEEEPESIVGTLDMDKLRASIVAETSKSKRSLDDLWKDPAPRDTNAYRPPSSDPSGTEILKKTMSDCAPVKAAKEINE